MKRAAAWCVTLAAAVLAGCASVTEELEAAKAGWLGMSYDEVVARWGAPARSATLSDGRQTHTWVSQETPAYAGGPQVGVGIFGGSGVGGGVGVGVGFPFGASADTRQCERNLTFRDGVVVEQHWTGDAAYCRWFRK